MLCSLRPAITHLSPRASHVSNLRPAIQACVFTCTTGTQDQRRHNSSKSTTKMTSHGPAKRLDGQKTSVWSEFVKLAADTKAINLGQGFPDFAAPDHVRKALIDVASSSDPLIFQYTRGPGHPRLVNAIAALYGRHMSREINAMQEILVTVGAYQSLFTIFMSIVSPGDEVIIIEPFFDCYEPMVKLARGTPRFIALKPKSDSPKSADEFELDPEELAGLFNEKTKAIVINTPNNPLGKVFKLKELEMIADLCKKHDTLCISDEVYEYMVYKGHKHVRMGANDATLAVTYNKADGKRIPVSVVTAVSTLPDMWDRTYTVCSAGKIFSATGFKMGWTIAPDHLMQHLRLISQNCTYTNPTPLQEALAITIELELSRLDQPECYLTDLSKVLETKRDKLAQLLREIGLSPIIPQGSYYMLANISHIDVDLSESGGGARDYKMVRWIVNHLGVATIPCSAFYCDEHKAIGEKYIRFCFIKEDSTLEKAAENLRKFKESR